MKVIFPRINENQYKLGKFISPFLSDIYQNNDWFVFAIMVFNGKLDFLVFQEPSCIYQMEIECFDIGTINIPVEWHINLQTGITGVSMICAPCEIINSKNIFPMLVDMNDEAIADLKSIIVENYNFK